MARFQCYPVDDPNSLWLFCPSYNAAIAFSVLFGLTILAHIFQACLHRKPFLIVLIMGNLWEVGGYIARTFSVTEQKNVTYYTFQQLLIILAPLWINAFCYMCLGRMIHCFMSPKEDKVFGLRARHLGTMFVLADIFAFIVQLSGAMLLGPDMSASLQKTGLNVYMGGVGMQLFFIFVFLSIAVKFQLMLRHHGAYYTTLGSSSSSNSNNNDLSAAELAHNTTYDPNRTSSLDPNILHHQTSQAPTRALPLLYALYAALTLIVFRNLYRLIEFSAGVESSITKNEWYTFVFDSTPMLLALLLFNVFHPGRFLKGPRADFEMEKEERRTEKRARKEAKREAKMAVEGKGGKGRGVA
ncbi:uncharacterized protein HMPREF1541_01002 [Cyphellophora europaea CBS 101466]|uniref:RTA1 domain protein n=1 Tax=Cyphellophora europaea (strain CBS 101466) TaxID=1220924 RepID=W2SFK1_CYPE1|nr:uncharacterized protein HMPREF1541_01002 [Cyphellophora europaea CBS 101466]ETN46813.1 hypothetical protein HMPREF1541_01002 [Cyphellophora europaea CBS 101466]